MPFRRIAYGKRKRASRPLNRTTRSSKWARARSGFRKRARGFRRRFLRIAPRIRWARGTRGNTKYITFKKQFFINPSYWPLSDDGQYAYIRYGVYPLQPAAPNGTGNSYWPQAAVGDIGIVTLSARDEMSHLAYLYRHARMVGWSVLITKPPVVAQTSTYTQELTGQPQTEVKLEQKYMPIYGFVGHEVQSERNTDAQNTAQAALTTFDGQSVYSPPVVQWPDVGDEDLSNFYEATATGMPNTAAAGSRKWVNLMVDPRVKRCFQRNTMKMIYRPRTKADKVLSKVNLANSRRLEEAIASDTTFGVGIEDDQRCGGFWLAIPTAYFGTFAFGTSSAGMSHGPLHAQFKMRLAITKRT